MTGSHPPLATSEMQRSTPSCRPAATLFLVALFALVAPARQAIFAPAAVDTSDGFAGGGKWIMIPGGGGVSISGDVLVGGSLGANVGAQGNQGSATVFRKTGFFWTEEQTLSSSTGDTNDLFGYSVDVEGDVVVVGAPFSGVAGVFEQGSATVFRWNGSVWLEEQQLTHSSGLKSDNFGIAVSINGGVIAVGAAFDDVGGNIDQGSVVVFRWNGASWVEEQTLVRSSGAGWDNFGGDVEVSGTTIAVGTPFAEVGAVVDAGTTTVFRWSGTSWLEEQTLSPAVSTAGANFGTSVSVDGDLLVGGAPGANAFAGAATVFRWDGSSWLEQSTLSALNPSPFDSFGSAVAVSGHSVLVGAFRDDFSGQNDRGTATVFRWNGSTWAWSEILTSSIGGALEYFGESVALDGETAAVGIPRSSLKKPLAGAAATYVLGGSTPWSDEGSGHAGIFGEPLLVCSGQLGAGSPILVGLTRAAPSSLAALLVAPSSTPLPLFGGTILPFPFLDPLLLPTSASGVVGFSFPMPPGVPPGSELWGQWVVFDPAAIGGFSMSNGVLGITP